MAKVLVVTSGKGGVGKTTSTAALGAALAQAGQKVVGRRLRRRPAQPRPGDGRRAPGGVRSHQRGAGRRQALAGADPRQAHRDAVAAAGLADPRQGRADRGGRRTRDRASCATKFDWVICDSPAGIERGATLRHALRRRRRRRHQSRRCRRCAIPTASSGCSIPRPRRPRRASASRSTS